MSADFSYLIVEALAKASYRHLSRGLLLGTSHLYRETVDERVSWQGNER